MKLLPEPMGFVSNFACQLIVVGGFSRSECCSSFVPKSSVVQPGLRGVIFNRFPVSSKFFLILASQTSGSRAQGKEFCFTLNLFSGRTLFITAAVKRVKLSTHLSRSLISVMCFRASLFISPCSSSESILR